MLTELAVLQGINDYGMCVQARTSGLKEHDVLQGINDSGMEDLLSGTVSGAFYLGGGAAPALAGSINSLFGFGWACTGMGFLMILQALALLIMLLFLRRPAEKGLKHTPERQALLDPVHHDEEQATANGEPSGQTMGAA